MGPSINSKLVFSRFLEDTYFPKRLVDPISPMTMQSRTEWGDSKTEK